MHQVSARSASLETITGVLVEREKGRDLTKSYAKAPTPIEKSKKKCDNTKTPPKTPITQRLRTDLGWSVGVAIASVARSRRTPQCIQYLFKVIFSKFFLFFYFLVFPPLMWCLKVYWYQTSPTNSL